MSRDGRKVSNFPFSKVSFPGLKLNKMGLLKEQLHQRQLNVKKSTFCIRFTIKEMTLESAVFRIVSSFSQLPKDLQTKRYARGTSKQPSDV